jgi:DNA-binding transcriptional ArsR family regulator
VQVTFNPHNEELKFLRDPVRRRLLLLLADKPEGVSIRQLARRLHEPTRRVRHFIGALVDAGLVVVENERPRRGTIERTYRAARFPVLWIDEWPEESQPAEVKIVLLDILRLIFDTVTSAIAAGRFLERRGWCVARTWREVDAQGWQELAETHERAAREVVATVERSKARLARSGEEAIPAISALLLLEALPWED